jgi:hypothetical protein
MPGTAKDYTTAKIPHGPGDVWINVALPAESSTIVLHTDGTPESVANPAAIHLGKVDTEGLQLVWKPSFEGQFSDENSAAYRYVLGPEEASISGLWLQLHDAPLLEKMSPAATRSTPTGKEILDFGGLNTFATYTVAVIWKMAEDTTKHIVFMLFKAHNEAGLDFNIRRGADARSRFTFRGQAISTRTAGKQIGHMWYQT